MRERSKVLIADRIPSRRARLELPIAIGQLTTVASRLVQAAILLAEGGVVALTGSHIPFTQLAEERWHFALATGLAYIAGAAVMGAWLRPRGGTNIDRAIRVLAAICFCAALFGQNLAVPSPGEAAELALWFALSSLGIVAIRTAAADIAARFPGLMPGRDPAVVVGSGPQAISLLGHLNGNANAGHHLVGFFDDRSARLGELSNALPYLGDVKRLIDTIASTKVRDVYVAMPWSDGIRISDLLSRLRYLPITVRLLPDHLPPALPNDSPFALDGVVMPTLMMPPFTTFERGLKRAFDFVVSSMLLILMLPLLLVVALMIKLDSAGPVFFRQTRTGQFGVGFEIFKFRSLHVAQADNQAETLVSRGDRRVTRVGKYLRKYSIDELPQVLNVLFGHMSLVGPRPHAPRAKADGQVYTDVMPDYPLRYRVKPGMTGWAQVHGWRGNTDTIEKLHRRVEYDFHYIENWSMARDLYILLRTVPSVVAPPPDNA